MKENKLKFETQCIHAGQKPDATTGSVMTPIHMTSTFVQSSPGEHQGFDYSRAGNPTRQVLENCLAQLEGGKHGFAFSSGMAATDCIMKLLNTGDHVITTNDLYGGSYRIFTETYQRYGITFDFVAMHNAADIEKSIKKETKLLWIETPTNPLLNIIDIEKCAAIAKKHKLILVVDNTFASPYLQQPISVGADIVMHSMTKYLGGHSDIIMGGLITNNNDLAEQIKFNQTASGAICSPMEAFLALRGIKTLHLRMQQHCKNALAIAKLLDNHHKIKKVYYPGLESHQGHVIAVRQMRDFGGMLSFVLKDDNMETASQLASATRLFTLAESLGGVESLIGHPATMTHASIPETERLKSGISNGLIRLSVGVEALEDLLLDLEQALDAT